MTIIDPPRAARLSDRAIPKSVRDHGSTVDPDTLEPGDLLLISKKKKPWISRKIVEFQAQMFAPEHARWHHAVVSGGRFEICEATTRGVTAGEYWKYMTGEYDIKVRRLKDAIADERSRVAYYAATHVRTKYAFGNLLGIGRALIGGNTWHRGRIVRSDGVVCSQLYFESCLRISIPLFDIPSDLVCPAHLSASEQMIDVPVSWVDLD